MSAIQPSTIRDRRKLKITIITMVPTVVIKLWISSVKLLFSASAIVSTSLVKWLISSP